MRIERRKLDVAGIPPGAVVGCALALSAALFAAWVRLGLPLASCRFREWTGLPCLTCGSTRMTESLIQGNVPEALSLNPLVFSTLVAVVIWAVASVVLRFSQVKVVFSPRERMVLRLATVAALVAGWAYLIWRGT